MWTPPTITRPLPSRAIDLKAFIQKVSRHAYLERYREGWAATDVAEIIAATASGYSFCDPLVGSFSQRSLHAYFRVLRDRLSRGGAIRRADTAFFLRGPMDAPSPAGEFQFWREAPMIGLTGISKIKIGDQGVIADCVAYDLNLATELLRFA
jgi:hypothetical protein